MTAPLRPLYAHLPDTDEVYVLGELEAPLLTFNITDEYGCAWLVEEPDGWDAPTFVTPMDNRQDGPGGYAGVTEMDPRPLGFSGMVSCPSVLAARRARARLLSAISGDLAGWVRYTHLDDDPAKSLWLRPSGKPNLQFSEDGYALVFAFTMVAENPLKFGAETTYGTARLPAANGAPGRIYPRTYPVTYSVGGAARQDTLLVPNAGDYSADALYRLTGPIPQPLIDLATGEYVGWSGTLGAADVLEVDTRAGTLQVNGVNRSDVLLAGSTFPQIPPGGTEVRLRSNAGGNDQAAGLDVTTAPTWK